MSRRLDWLARCLHKSDAYAEWIHQQFHYEYAHQPLAQWQERFRARDNEQWLMVRDL
ncbi:hypothetical protein [Pseudomonas sp. NPDC087615]|uniref:hypothetical protein n=1 Tax=Pseudomonas TaxID=286 RepID=UPI0021AB3AF8